MVSFYGLSNFIIWWVGGLFQLFWWKGGDFQELGYRPLFGLMVSLRTVLVLVDVLLHVLMHYNEHIMRLKVYWPWTLLLLNSCHVLWPYHSFKCCALPSSLLFQSPVSSFTLIFLWEAEGQLPSASKLSRGVDSACRGVKISGCLIQGLQGQDRVLF